MKKLVFIFTVLIFSNSILQAQTATVPSGSGTQGDPFQIATLENLYWITQNSSSWGSYFIQTSDIDASSSSAWDGGAGLSPIGNYPNYFTGTYHGKGYKITGIYINRPTTSDIGLFNAGIDSKIDSLGLVSVNITGEITVGGLTGFSLGTIDYCYTTGTVTATSIQTVGGISGGNSGTISNSYSTCTVTGTGGSGVHDAGGFVGYNSGTIFNSYSTGSVSNVNNDGGGFVGQNQGTITNSYSTGSVSGSIHIGGFVGYNSSGTINYCYSIGGSSEAGFVSSNSGTVSNSFWDTEASGINHSYGYATGKTTAEMKTLSTFTNAGWDFVGETTNGTTDPWGFNGTDNSGYPFFVFQGYPTAVQPSGAGTVGDPYQITSLNNLYWVSKNKPSWSKYFIQKNDIDASSTSKWENGSGFSPIGQVNTTSFSGTYKGKGYTITGLTINRLAMNYVGFFGVIYGGKVDSLGMVDLDIQGQSGVGGIAGTSYQGTISSCFTSGTLYALYDWVGGCVGQNQVGSISNSYSRCNVSGGGGSIGGLVGENISGGSINNSYSTGSVSVGSSLGGLVSYNDASTVSNSFWDTETSGQSSSAGGTGKTTAEMKTQSTFTDAGWNFVTIWGIDEVTNDGYPVLGWQTPVTPTSGSYTNVTVYAPTTLSGNLTVGGTLTVGAQITTGSNTINLGTTGSLSGETPSNYIVGTIQTTRDLSTSQSNIAGLGISIDPQSNNLGNTTIKRETGSSVNAGAVKQIWTITPETQPSGPVSVTLTWPSTNDNSINLNDLVVYKSSDGGDTWNVVSAVINKDTDPRTATFTITSFSIFTIGESAQPLPVELSSFTATVAGDGVKLNWSTTTETTNSGWEIEQRLTVTGETGLFRKVGFVAGKGTTTEAQTYSFAVSGVKANLAEFRLKQIDMDGKSTYSQILSLEVKPSAFELSQNYPNPFNPSTTIRYSVAAAGPVSLKLYNSLGQLVKTLVQSAQPAGFYSVPLNAADLSSGIYFYVLEAGSFKSVKKLTLLK